MNRLTRRYRMNMRNVQVLGYLAVLILVGCEQQSAQEPSEDLGIFGSPYQIVTNLSPADPDEPPIIIDDTLRARITYPGGCADHLFQLMHEVRVDTAWVWLRHESGGDGCEALIHDEIELAVPQQVLAAPSIMLLNPNADVPFVLRWGRRNP